jgi:hypothetical protein
LLGYTLAIKKERRDKEEEGNRGGLFDVEVMPLTKTLMSSVMVFNGVYRPEIQLVMLVFSTGFVNYCPSNLLSG